MRWLLVLIAACAPVVDGPAERARTADRADEQRLATQLTALPGVVRAETMIRRPARDPLADTPSVAPSASIVVIIDDRADRQTTLASARQLAAVAVPGVEPAIVVEVGAVRPVLAKVGPFTVEERSKTPLKAALAGVLALIAALAGWIALRLRPRVV
jgi:type III secretory pathway lipoprotein EscJ